MPITAQSQVTLDATAMQTARVGINNADLVIKKSALTLAEKNQIQELLATTSGALQTAETAATAWVTANPVPVPPAPPVPVATSFFVPPGTDAIEAVASLKAAGQTAEAALIEKIASQPQATWLGAWNQDNGTIVDSLLSEAKGATAIFVVWGLPYLEGPGSGTICYSTSAAYETFIQGIAAAVKGRPALFIIEPDGLDQIPTYANWTTAMTEQREQLITYAVDQLIQVSKEVYIDAGCSVCQPLSVIEPLLKASGIASATGFALNTSGFNSTADEVAYGNQLSAAVGGKHYVIDTSRNGGDVSIVSGNWCNPEQALLGVNPTTETNMPLCDAFLWVKYPGQSDGNFTNIPGVNCHGGPPSGAWFLSYALGLCGS